MVTVGVALGSYLIGADLGVTTGEALILPFPIPKGELGRLVATMAPMSGTSSSNSVIGWKPNSSAVYRTR